MKDPEYIFPKDAIVANFSGGIDSWKKLAFQFLDEDLPAKIEKMRHIIATGDRAGLIALLHQIKGTASILRMPVLTRQCSEWENALRIDDSDNDARRHLMQLHKTVGRLRRQAREFLP